MANISIPVLGSLLCYLDIRSLGRAACVNNTWRAAANSKQIEQELGRREGEALPPEKLKEFINRLPTLGCVLSRQSFTRQNVQELGRTINASWGMSIDNGEIFTPAWTWDGKALHGVVKVWSLNLQHLRDLPTKHIESQERRPKPYHQRGGLPKGLHNGWEEPIARIAVCGNTLATLGREGRIDLSSRDDGRLLRSISVGEMDASASYRLALDEDTVYLGQIGAGGKGIFSWETNTGKSKRSMHCNSPLADYSVNGGKIYVSMEYGTLFRYDKNTLNLDASQKTVEPMRALARGRLFCAGRTSQATEVSAYETTHLSPLWQKSIDKSDADSRFTPDCISFLGTDGLDPFVCIESAKQGIRIEIWNGATGAKKATLCKGLQISDVVHIAAVGPMVYVLEDIRDVYRIVSYNCAPPPPQPQKPAR